jgi:hypothetical protein
VATTPENRRKDPEPRALLPLFRWIAYGGGGLFALFNLIVSTVSIYKLGTEALHLEEIRSAALAGGLDAGALVAGSLWVGGRIAHQKLVAAWGKFVTLGLVTVSCIGNAGEVAFQAHLLSTNVMVALAIGLAIFAPVATMVMGHLALLVVGTSSAPGALHDEEHGVHLSKKPRPAAAPAKSSAPAPAEQHAPQLPPAPQPQPMPAAAAFDSPTEEQETPAAETAPLPAMAGTSKDKVLGAVLHLTSQGEKAGPAAIAEVTGISYAQTKKLLDTLQDDQLIDKAGRGNYIPKPQLRAV